jgi:hypothetical protein
MEIDLDNLSIAAPCSANWNEMSGDERARFCGLCKKHVYNISAMSRTEAQALIKQKEGPVCIRMFKRADGTLIVDNCLVGLHAIRDHVRWVRAGIVACAATVLTFAGVVASGNSHGSGANRSTLKTWLFPPKVNDQPCVMGEMMPPAPRTPINPSPAAAN